VELTPKLAKNFPNWPNFAQIGLKSVMGRFLAKLEEIRPKSVACEIFIYQNQK
jgi:hypothetical protein